MQTDAFWSALEDLMAYSKDKNTAIMCAEAVWWRCHRGLIADVLRWQGLQVCHILSKTSTVPHPYTSAARVTRRGLSYRPTPK